jgi:hypothetical protein
MIGTEEWFRLILALPVGTNRPKNDKDEHKTHPWTQDTPMPKYNSKKSVIQIIWNQIRWGEEGLPTALGLLIALRKW